MSGLASAARNPDAEPAEREQRPAPEPSAPATITVGTLDIDVLKHRVTVSGARVRVTPMQMRLLVHLARRRDEVVTRTALLRDVWGYRAEAAPQTRTVDIHVQRLRDRLGAAAALISTVRGVGYRLSEDPE